MLSYDLRRAPKSSCVKVHDHDGWKQAIHDEVGSNDEGLLLPSLRWPGVDWRVPNPPGANPLVAERAFPAGDYWGRTGVARCAEEMRQESG